MTFRASFLSNAGPAMKTIGIHRGIGMFSLSILVGALTYVGLLAWLKRRRAQAAAATASLPP